MKELDNKIREKLDSNPELARKVLEKYADGLEEFTKLVVYPILDEVFKELGTDLKAKIDKALEKIKKEVVSTFKKVREDG